MASSNEVIDRVPRILSGDPTVATGAATKQYVDAVRASIPTTLPPSGTAGGDLSGTYPNPQVKSTIELADIRYTCISENAPITSSTAGFVISTGGPFVRQYANGPNSSYASIATSSLPANIVVDLLNQYDYINGIFLQSNRPGDNRYWPSAGSIDCSTDNSTWTTGVASWSNSGADALFLSLATAPANTRYIRINLTGAPLVPSGQTTTAISNCFVFGQFGGSSVTKIVPPSGYALQAVSSTGVEGAYLNTGPGSGTFTIGTKNAAASVFGLINAAGSQILTVDQSDLSITGTFGCAGITSSGVISVPGSGSIGNGGITSSGAVTATGEITGSIITTNAASQGYAALVSGGSTNAGYLSIWNHAGTRLGYIGYTEGTMNYSADSGSHTFNQTVNVPALNVSGTTSHSAGTNYGSTVASSTSDLSRHIALWGATFGFCVTGSSLNYNSGGAHNFWQAVTVNSTLNVTGASTLTGAVTAPGGLTVSGCVMNGTDGWFRSSGQAGGYNSTYGGGWYMIDTTYFRSYQNKAMVASDFVISSDRKLKTNIKDLKPRNALRPRTFTIIETGQETAGFVAQELEKDCPEAVQDVVDEDGVTITKHVSPMPVIAVLSAQINELQEQVRLLQGKPKKTLWNYLKGLFS